MFDKEKIVPCIDWFRGIVPITDVDKFCFELAQIDERLALNNFVCDGRSKLNFKNCWRHNDVPSLSFSFNPQDEGLSCLFASDTHNNSGVLFELTGDAIRFLGSDVLKNVLTYFHSLGTKCTRIDYALDFFDKDNDIVPLMQEGCSNFMNPGTRDITVSGKIKRCPSNLQIYINSYPKEPATMNYTLGNHGSDHGMFRLYDKRFETLYGRNRQRAQELMKGDGTYWYRAELELHNGKEVPWANDSFSHLVVSDFNIYAVIGHTFDSWFGFKIREFASDTTYLDIELWEEFVAELKQCIHFVELVHQKFVARNQEYCWNQIIHNSVWLSTLLDVAQNDMERLKTILEAARVRRGSESKYLLKYGSILKSLGK